jgi:hypothetical protein
LACLGDTDRGMKLSAEQHATQRIVAHSVAAELEGFAEGAIFGGPAPTTGKCGAASERP